jgi:LEA14-like dessication related protein
MELERTAGCKLQILHQIPESCSKNICLKIALLFRTLSGGFRTLQSPAIKNVTITSGDLRHSQERYIFTIKVIVAQSCAKVAQSCAIYLSASAVQLHEAVHKSHKAVQFSTILFISTSCSLSEN